MFTTCPECGTVFRIGPAQLRAAEGFVRCGTCAATFNALLSLTDEPPAGAGGAESTAPATTAAPSLAAGGIPPIVARTADAAPPAPAPAGPPASAPAPAPEPGASGAEPRDAPASAAAPPGPPVPAAALPPQASPFTPAAPAPPASPVPPVPPGAASAEEAFADDAGELAIPDDFGPESWDDTLDLPQPAANLRMPDDDAVSDEEEPDDADGLSGEPLPDDLDDELDDEPEDEDGDTLAGVVEHADWESLLTGLDDDDEAAEPVYIVGDEPPAPASPPAPRATTAPVEGAQVAGAVGQTSATMPTGREPAAPAGDPGSTGALADLPDFDDHPWPPQDEDGDQLPPLGTLDDVLHDDQAVAPLPTLGHLADDDEPLDEPDEAAGDDEPEVAWDEADDPEPVPALDAAGDVDEPPPHAADPLPLTAAALAAAARQSAPGAAPAREPAQDPDSPEPWADRPAWPPDPEPAPRGRWLYGAGSLLLMLALAAQFVTHQRDELATHPEWGPLVRDLYARLDMDVYPAWDLSAYEVRGSEAVAGRSATGALDIVARLAVVGDQPVGLPLVRVTLRDRRGDVLGQRVVAAAEYLPADAALAEPLGPGTLIPVEVSLPDPGVDASGYEVDICLLARAQGLVCQGEREPFQR